MSEIKLNFKLSTILITVLIFTLLCVGVWKYYSSKINDITNTLETEVKLKNALLDSTKYYRNIRNELVAEKLTIQYELNDLKDKNQILTHSQKELLSRIGELNKENKIIAAALLETEIRLDSFIHAGNTVVNVTDKSITFSDNYVSGKKIMSYGFTVNNVLPASNIVKPSLVIDSLRFPNKQFINFHWKNDKKIGYPVAFSVSNSNDFFKTTNIDSYIIPEINKEVINPTGWQKIVNFFNKSKNTIITFGIGGLAGATTVLFLVK